MFSECNKMLLSLRLLLLYLPSEYECFSDLALLFSAGRTVVSIDSYEDVPVNNEAALLKAVSSQPVSVAICASQAMQFYSSGVIAGEGTCTGLNHGVLAAGYDKVCRLFASRQPCLL